MKNAGYKSGGDKTSAAKACMQKWSACYSTCKSGADKFQNSDNWSTFDSNATTCVGLKDKVGALTTASNDSANAATAGQNCDSNSSSSPSAGSGGDNAKDSAKDAAAEKSAECAANPNAVGCAAATAEATKYADAAKGSGGFNQPDAGGGSADVADTSGVNADPAGALGTAAAASTPAKNGTIANNSGGGIPGGGGSANSGGGGNSGGILGAVSSAITDIEKGFQSGGFSGAVAALLADEPPPAPAAPPGDANGRDPASLTARNLADFLPGHRNGPPLIKAPPTAAQQINGPTVSLFSRISAKYREKCILGELFDCA